MNEEIKEAFSRLYFSPDEVNEELAIAMKSLITKEDFIDILVDRYKSYLTSRIATTRKGVKCINHFVELFRGYLVFYEVYKGDFEAVATIFQRANSTKKTCFELHYFAKMRNAPSITTLDFMDFNTGNILRIPYPSTNKFYRSNEMLDRW